MPYNPNGAAAAGPNAVAAIPAAIAKSRMDVVSVMDTCTSRGALCDNSAPTAAATNVKPSDATSTAR
jgi:hypothetical protein